MAETQNTDLQTEIVHLDVGKIYKEKGSRWEIKNAVNDYFHSKKIQALPKEVYNTLWADVKAMLLKQKIESNMIQKELEKRKQKVLSETKTRKGSLDKEIKLNSEGMIYLIKSIESVRDEIKGSSKWNSISWYNKDQKKQTIQQLENTSRIFKSKKNLNGPDAYRLLSSLITDSDVLSKFYPLFNKDATWTISPKFAGLKIMKENVGETQITEVFVEDMADTFVVGKAKLNGEHLAKINRETEKQMTKMAGNIRKAALEEWKKDGAKITAANPEIKSEEDLITVYNKLHKQFITDQLAIKYVGKYIIGEAGGIPVPADKQDIWETFKNSTDIKDEWFTLSLKGRQQAIGFLAYDVPAMLISGFLAGGVAKLGGGLLLRSIATSARLQRIAGIAIDGTKVTATARRGYVVKTAGFITKAGVEGTAFTAFHSGFRKQEWFLNNDDWHKEVLTNSLMFGSFGAAEKLTNWIYTKIPAVGEKLLQRKAIDGLIKQGLAGPALYTGANFLLPGDLNTFSEKEINEIGQELALMAIMGGGLHFASPALEKFAGGFSRLKSGDLQVKINDTNGTGEVTTKSGATFRFKVSEKIKAGLNKLKTPKSILEARKAKKAKAEAKKINQTKNVDNKMTTPEMINRRLNNLNEKLLKEYTELNNKYTELLDEFNLISTTEERKSDIIDIISGKGNPKEDFSLKLNSLAGHIHEIKSLLSKGIDLNSQEISSARKILAEAKSGISKDIVEQNALLSDDARVTKAERLLQNYRKDNLIGKNLLSQEQKAAIIEMHNSGKGVYENTVSSLRQKLSKLKRQDGKTLFTKDEIRILMEHGILGKDTRGIREMLSSPKNGDIIIFGDKSYRYITRGKWQEGTGNQVWGATNRSELPTITTEDLSTRIIKTFDEAAALRKIGANNRARKLENEIISKNPGDTRLKNEIDNLSKQIEDLQKELQNRNGGSKGERDYLQSLIDRRAELQNSGQKGVTKTTGDGTRVVEPDEIITPKKDTKNTSKKPNEPIEAEYTVIDNGDGKDPINNPKTDDIVDDIVQAVKEPNRKIYADLEKTLRRQRSTDVVGEKSQNLAADIERFVSNTERLNTRLKEVEQRLKEPNLSEEEIARLSGEFRSLSRRIKLRNEKIELLRQRLTGEDVPPVVQEKLRRFNPLPYIAYAVGGAGVMASRNTSDILINSTKWQNDEKPVPPTGKDNENTQDGTIPSTGTPTGGIPFSSPNTPKNGKEEPQPSSVPSSNADTVPTPSSVPVSPQANISNGDNQTPKPSESELAEKKKAEILNKINSLNGDLKSIYKNQYKQLEKIGLGDAFFGADKGIEFDENPVRLDYDGWIDGRIIVDENGKYVITLDDEYKTPVIGDDLFTTLQAGWNTINAIKNGTSKSGRTEKISRRSAKRDPRTQFRSY